MLSHLLLLPLGFCPWLSTVWLQCVSVRILRFTEILGCLWNIYWMCVKHVFVCFIKSAAFLAVIISDILSAPFSLCSPSGIYIHMFVCLMLYCKSLRLSSFSFLFFFLLLRLGNLIQSPYISKFAESCFCLLQHAIYLSNKIFIVVIVLFNFSISL